MRYITAVLVSVGFAACDGSTLPRTEPDASPGDGVVDATVATATCWPEGAQIPRGGVTVGAGATTFAPMPETLPLEWGFQDGFMVKVRTRMQGFDPGAAPIINPNNPFTRVRAYMADTGVPLATSGPCADREWYLPTATGELDVQREIAVVFDTCWRIDRLLGARLRIDVELMDHSGSYATDSRIITAVEPVNEYPVDVTPADCGPP